MGKDTKATNPTPTESATPRTRHTSVKVVGWCVVTLVALVAIVFMLAGVVVEHFVEKHDSGYTGRRIEIGDIDINLLRGRVGVQEFTIYESDSTTPFVSANNLNATIALGEIFDNTIHITECGATGLDAHIANVNEAFNFESLVEHILNRFSSEESSSEESSVWNIAIDNVAIQNSSLSYDDDAAEQHWHLSHINLTAPHICLTEGTSDIEASMNINESAYLVADAGINIPTMEFVLDGTLDSFMLADIYPIARQMVNISSLAGDIGGNIHAEGCLSDIGNMLLRGDIAAHNIIINDSHNNLLLGVDNLSVGVKELDLARGVYNFTDIIAEGYSTRFVMNSEGNNFDELFYGEPEVSLETETESLGNDMYDVRERVTLTTESEVAPMSGVTLFIDNLALSGGNVHFVDNTLATPFEYNITGIAIESRGFDIKGNNTLTIRGKLPKQGSALLQWKGSLTDFYNQDLLAVLTNVNMRDFTPYVEHYTAFPVTGGNLTFRSQNIISNGNLSGVNNVDTYKFSVGDKNKDLDTEFNLPLKTGIFILTDNRQHINIDLPVAGRVDSPEFSYRKIILHALSNLLVKMVSTPFEWMNPEKQEIFKHIGFDLLEPGLNSEHYARLDRIAEALKQNSSLKVRLKQRVDYNKSTERLADLNLRIAYYNAHQAEPDKRLDMLDFTRINEMRIGRNELMEFADSQIVARGLDPANMSLDQKCRILFEQNIDLQLENMLSHRNRIIDDYIKFQHPDLTEGTFVVEDTDIEALKSYKGADRYIVTLILDDNEIVMDSSSEEAGTVVVSEDSSTNTSEPTANTETTSTTE